MDRVIKIIFIPITGMIIYALANTALLGLGVDVTKVFAAAPAKRPPIEICEDWQRPRPEKQTIWGPVSTGSDTIQINCRMVER